MRKRNVPILALVSLLGMACGGGDPAYPGGDDGGGQAGQAAEIDLVDFAYSRPTVTIQVGTTVRWRNTTGTLHTVTPDGHSAWNAWETNTQGETFEVTFDQVGTYPYYCVPHRSQGMTGTIIVQ